jgi:predicted dehydrogenase
LQNKNDGATYAPKGKAAPVCGPGEFSVGVIGLDHGHIFGMCNGLVEAGATIGLVYDPDAAKVGEFLKEFPGAVAARSREEVFASPAKLIATAAVPCDRAGIGVAAMNAGKDCFSDKPAFTSREGLESAREASGRTGRKFFVYFSERLHVEGSVCAGELIKSGAIGRVLSVVGMGPHRLSASSRPAWFWEKEKYGGILVDIGCHQIEQIVHFAGAGDARIVSSRSGNYANRQYSGFEDFGDAALVCDNGAAGYFKVDWFTPDGLGAWGDGRTLITGTDGYIEIRKYINVAESPEGDHVYYVNGEGERHIMASGKYGFPFFGAMIRDCLDRTETAMAQDYVFRISQLAIEAREHAQTAGFEG